MNSEVNGPRRAVPVVDGERCVHARSPSARCRACVEACPTGAFVLGDEALGIRESACDGCGLCRPVCPERAIDLPFAPLQRRNRGDELALFARCERTDGNGPGRVACVHALGIADFERLERRRLAAVVLWAGACAACPRRQAVDAGDRVAAYNDVRRSRGQTVIDLQRIENAEAWRQALALYPEPAERVDPSRRRLLAAFRGGLDEEQRPRAEPQAPGPGWLYHHRPQIDAATCNGCDACINVCPHKVLAFERDGHTGSFYTIAPAGCTGCGLCGDVCAPQAIGVLGLGPVEQAKLPLASGKCYKCGVPYHRPAAQKPDDHGLCRICTEKDPTSKLYQVYD